LKDHFLNGALLRSKLRPLQGLLFPIQLDFELPKMTLSLVRFAAIKCLESVKDTAGLACREAEEDWGR
jgi:hypothetical protein